jgi:uncharacterized protein YqjF (DUF2071 family)
MKTVFQDLLLLTYAVEPERLAPLLPPMIYPYVRDGQSYVSIVVGNMRGMRPSVIPEFLGTNYYQIVYRAVVRLRRRDGAELPGVFFLRSDSNDPVMSYFGNRLTEFRFHYFHTGAIALMARGNNLLVSVQTKDKGGDLVAHARDLGSAEALEPAAGFATVADEKNTLVQLFHAYAYNPEREHIYDLEIERGEWQLRRLDLIEHFAAYFHEKPFDTASAKPTSHVYIHDCAYIWKPMRVLDARDFVVR